MINSDYSFVEYFILAQTEALTVRESYIVDLRYGFTNGEPRTLEQVGEVLGLSRERIRQILQRVHRKIHSKGKRQIAKGQSTEASARLLLYLEETLKPTEPGNLDRIFDFARNELAYLPQATHALPLLIHLLYGRKEQGEEYLAQLIHQHRQAMSALRRAEKADTSFKNLVASVMWPQAITSNSHTFEIASKLNRQREVSLDGMGMSGTFFSQKLGRDVQYESLLELRFLFNLEQVKEVVFYQEQPFVIPYELDGVLRTYYPDIFFVMEGGRGVVVEVKPLYQMALHENLTKWLALQEYCIQNGWGLLVTDGKRSFQKLQQYELSVEFQAALLLALANSKDSTLSWVEYRGIKDQYNATWNDFLAVILKNRLIWRLKPFILEQRS